MIAEARGPSLDDVVVDLKERLDAARGVEEPPAGFFDDFDGVYFDVPPPRANDDVHLLDERPTYRDVVGLALAIGKPTRRLETGIASLDSQTRGGLPLGTIVVIAAPPNGGKSTLCNQLLRHFARSGVHVAALIADETPEDVLMRWGQSDGISRDELEGGHQGARERLADVVRSWAARPLLVDGDEGGATIEAVADELHHRAGGAGVLFLDSLQNVRAAGTADAKSKKDRLDAVIAACRRVRKQHGHLILATCEVPRGFYRSKRPHEQIDARAAFKESGDVEYAAKLALVLRTMPAGQEVDVIVAKNKIGRERDFRLAHNFTTATMFKVALPDDEEATVDDCVDDERDVHAVVALLLEKPGIAGKRGVREEAKARGLRIGSARLDAALAALGVDHDGSDPEACIEDRREKGKPRWFIRPDRVAQREVAT